MNIKSLEIRKRMMDGGMNQKTLAEVAGITPAGVSVILRKGSCVYESAAKIAKALECDVADIVSLESDR